MYFRALARETDGDFTKFVDNTKKPFDEAQKWRVFKNITRFQKNPIAYIYWKVEPFHANGRMKIMYFLLGFNLITSAMLNMHAKMQKEGRCKMWRWRNGETSYQYDTVKAERSMPYDIKKNAVRYSNFHQKRRNKRTSAIMTNWWCRDQNFRKYFQMRKKHDIRPSETGFYHEPLYEETVRKNVEWAAMRKAQQAK